MIWDEDINCEHKWGGSRKIPAQTQWNTGGVFDPDKRKTVQVTQEIKGEFCSLCGAWRGCLGLEPTIELYLKHLLEIFDEAKRVLRDDGVCFVNLGDTYSGSGGEHKPWHKSDSGFQHKGGFSKHCLSHEFGKQKQVTQAELDADAKRAKDKNYPTQAFAGYAGWDRNTIKPQNIPTKSLCLIPFRFAIAMVERGWILRNTIIWSKPNPMPSSAKDRFTVDFEYVFFFVKKKKYWFEPQYEECLTECNAERPRMGQGQNTQYNQKRGEVGRYQRGEKSKHFGFKQDVSNPLGRNKRTTWTIPTEAFPEAHFATFPEKLVEPMIKCGCPEFVCKKCGKARTKIMDLTEEYAPLIKTFRVTDFDGREIGKYIQSGLDRKGWTQSQLAEYFPSKTGGTTGCVHNWINGKNIPTAGQWRIIKNALSLGNKFDLLLQNPATGENIGWVSADVGYGIKVKRQKPDHPSQVPPKTTFKGYASCSCNAGYEPGVVLDFFCGSGTIGKVAAYLRRNYILIDAKEEYCQMAEERVKEPETGLTVAEQRQGQGGLFE